ncbi:hypothetical protein L596_009926 [Steinernema carpocapsae]|uniref:Uncharacterized protein n=1 Tax=Steinernema carpocapsae TaxID=34508 RepID=A0A4U5PHA1_STECR|nr:hypothetical protein L596_009926 [Steinernema carpocapsae]
MVGLDNAGKTTILYKWKTGEVYKTVPTIGFNVETIYHKGVAVTIWDINGQGEFYKLWDQYIDNDSPGVIFVLNSAEINPDLIAKSSKALHQFMNSEALKESVVLIMANKSDLSGARSKDEVVEKWKLKELKHPWRIQCTSAATEDGLEESLDWLADQLTQKQASSGYLC